MRIVTTFTSMPHAGRSLHAQGFVGTHMVVLPAIGIEPGLRFFSRRGPRLQRPFQGAMKTFYFALRLGVAKPAPMELDSLLHQPYRQVRGAGRGPRTPPRGA